jgi:hypothetical protein
MEKSSSSLCQSVLPSISVFKSRTPLAPNLARFGKSLTCPALQSGIKGNGLECSSAED